MARRYSSQSRCSLPATPPKVVDQRFHGFRQRHDRCRAVNLHAPAEETVGHDTHGSAGVTSKIPHLHPILGGADDGPALAVDPAGHKSEVNVPPRHTVTDGGPYLRAHPGGRRCRGHLCFRPEAEAPRSPCRLRAPEQAGLFQSRSLRPDRRCLPSVRSGRRPGLRERDVGRLAWPLREGSGLLVLHGVDRLRGPYLPLLSPFLGGSRGSARNAAPGLDREGEAADPPGRRALLPRHRFRVGGVQPSVPDQGSGPRVRVQADRRSDDAVAAVHAGELRVRGERPHAARVVRSPPAHGAGPPLFGSAALFRDHIPRLVWSEYGTGSPASPEGERSTS